MSDLRRRDARRVRDQQRREELLVTTNLDVPALPEASVSTDLIGRWNILDRGVRPLVVRSDGTFTLFDHRDGRTDGRWLRVSDTFVSLFFDGPKRHSMYAMPDGQVFLSRYALPGSVSTPELLFRSVLSFEGTWETPYRASQYTPAPPTRMSLGADRTFCAYLGQRGGEEGSVVVWSGIWARTGAALATLDYVAWAVTDGARRMAGHGQTTLGLRDDGTMTVAALDDVFYPVPGAVRAEGEDPLRTAEEPDVLLCPLAVDPPEADETVPGDTAGPAEPAPEVEAPSPPEGPVDQESSTADASSDAAVARRHLQPLAPLPAQPPASQQDVGTVGLLSVVAQSVAAQQDSVVTVELPPVDQPDAVAARLASLRDAVATVELASVDQPDAVAARLASLRDAVVTVELASVDLADTTGLAEVAVGNGAAVPVAPATADDRTHLVVPCAGEDDGLQVGAVSVSGLLVPEVVSPE